MSAAKRPAAATQAKVSRVWQRWALGLILRAPRWPRMPFRRPRWYPPAVERRLADTLFAFLLLVVFMLAGWLAARHELRWDWSRDERHGLSPESQALLARLDAPLSILVFAPPHHRVAHAVEGVLRPYRQARSDLQIEYIDPQRFPERARAAEARLLGQLVLEYRGRRETLTVLNETTLTQAIARLLWAEPPWIAVLEGHGERGLLGEAGFDLTRFAQALEARGFRLQPVDLARHRQIPGNARLVLLSMPAIALFPGESEALLEYLERGGNLLWLLDPDAELRGWEPLATALGLERLPGQILDATGQRPGTDAVPPTVAAVTDWPAHPLGAGLARPAWFPGSGAFAARVAPPWRIEAVFATGAASWNETGPLAGRVARDPALGEQAGPLVLGLALARPHPTAGAPRMQRVAVFGDGDFLSNASLDLGSNLALGVRLARWLEGSDDALVAVSDTHRMVPPLRLTPLRGTLTAVLALVALPLLWLSLGLGMRWQRGGG